jgi:hypothetical protein
MIPDSTADSIFTALNSEVVKVYQVFDGSDRVIEKYEALANTPDGGPCLKTEYVYSGAMTVAQKMKESQSTWLAAYDI